MPLLKRQVPWLGVLVSKWILPVALVAVLVAPRAARIAHPNANLADEAIFYLPFLASTGLAPYTDFACPYNPGSVWLLGGAYAVFGASYRVAEGVTAVLATGIAGLLFVCGRRAFGPLGGFVAAAVFAWHPLIVAYHVFAVELCTALCVWGAIALLQQDAPLSLRQVSAIALLMTAAWLFKQSAAGPALGVALCLWFARGERRSAVRYVVVVCLLAGAATAALALRYGAPYIEQTLIFHWAKGEACPLVWRPILFIRKCCDPLSLLGAAGLALFTLRRSKDRKALVVAWLFAAELLVNVLLSSTYWSHTHIPMCAYLAFFAGYLAREARTLAPRLAGAAGGARWRALKPFALAALCAAALVALSGENVWRAARVCDLPWGLGGVSRQGIREIADYVSSHSDPAGRIFAPPFVCLEAHRRSTVDNVENAGVMAWVEQTMREEGFRAVMRKSRGRSFWDMIVQCRPYWVVRVEKEMAARALQVVVLPEAWAIEYPEKLSDGRQYRVAARMCGHMILTPRPVADSAPPRSQ